MKKNILFLLLIAISQILSNDHIKNENIKVGKKVKVLDQEQAVIRIYIFTDINACLVCNQSITNIDKTFGAKEYIEIKVIFSSLTQDDAENLKEKNNWKLDVIGDKHNIYFDFYNIKNMPLIVILNNNGKVIEYEKLGESLSIRDIITIYESEEPKLKKETTNNYLNEINRFEVHFENGNRIASGKMYRNLLLNESDSVFYYRNKAQVPFYKIGSNGEVIKKINFYDNTNLLGYNGFPWFSWAEKDSLMAVYNATGDYQPVIQLYDVSKDSIVKNIYFSMKSHDSSLTYGYKTYCFEGHKLFHQYYSMLHNIKPQKLNENVKVSFLLDFNGKIKAKFNSPDHAYQKHKISKFMSVNTVQIDSNKFITNQFFSNILKYWTFDGKKIKEVSIDLGKKYRKIDSHAVKLINNHNPKFNNHISRKNQLLYDRKQKRSLVCYYNDTYPPNVKNYLSPKIKTKKYIIISNDSGKRLTNRPIQVHKSFIPFYFHDDIIYASELDNDRHLEIVKYKFVPNQNQK